MTMLAGIYTMGETVAPDAKDITELSRELGRSGDEVVSKACGRFFLAKIDIGAYAQRAFLFDDENIAIAATGKPLLDANSCEPQPRDRDLLAIRKAWPLSGPDILSRCRGTYSLSVYERDSDRLYIATDKVGARPIYFAIQGNILFFASARRLLEILPSLTLSMDIRGVTEEVVLGVSLADRTSLAPIKVLRGGELLTADKNGWTRRHYARWSDAAKSKRPQRDDLLAAVHTAFLDAVSRRAPEQGPANSFLSGGLDARVVAAALVATGHRVRSLTYEYPGLLDGPLARKVAVALGTEHKPVPVDHRIRQRDLKANAASYLDNDGTHNSSATIFSGDGGSVGLGYVYMDFELVASLRDDDTSGALNSYLSKHQLPSRALQASLAEEMGSFVEDGIRAELAAAGTGDPARDFHIFLLDNDQRRHLHPIFENLDRTRTEFELPFFDGHLLDLTMSAPVDWFIAHDFYYEWLEHFPACVRNVPWQAYPGHLPCPNPPDENLGSDQWRQSKNERYAASSAVFRRCYKSVLHQFPTEVLNRPSIMAGMILHGLRLRDYSYVWNMVDTIQTAYRRAEGRINLH